MQENERQQTAHPQQRLHHPAQVNRFEQQIGDRNAEQDGKMETDIHAAQTSERPRPT